MQARSFFESMLLGAVVLAFVPHGGCCGSTGRDWTVTGQVLDAETSDPVRDAQVQIRFVFAIDGPGNQQAQPVLTDSEGRFVSQIRFIASCAPVAFGFFGSEAGNTSGPPRWLDVTVFINGLETTREFNVRLDESITVTSENKEFGIEGSIALPAMLVSFGR